MSTDEIFKVSLNKSMVQCSQKELCTDDIRKKLSLWGVEDSDTKKILDILLRENFINETRYAAAFARDKFKYNKWGKAKIAAHLKSKRISSENIGQALDTIDHDQYVNFLRGLIQVHKRSIKAKNQTDLKAKLFRYGVSKGFESSLVYDLLNDLE